MQVDPLHWKGQFRHDLDIDALIALYMNLSIVILVGKQLMHSVQWMVQWNEDPSNCFEKGKS